MKKLIFNVALALAVVFGLGSCGYDNFDEPESTLSGYVQYEGQNLQLPGSGGVVQLQAYQDGYQLHSPISIYVDQNGHFSAKLFDGVYKLVTRDKNGPWVNKRDTITVTLKGSKEVNIPVTPYYTLSDFKCTLSGKKLDVSFNVQQIVKTASINYATLCIGTTSILDEQNNAMQVKLPGAAIKVGANSFSLDVSDAQLASLQKAVKVTARVGLRTVDADCSIYTPMVSLK